jgi:heavy metal efflux system protein
VVGGMFIGPIILLIVVPALQTLLLDRADRASPEGTPGLPQPAEFS